MTQGVIDLVVGTWNTLEAGEGGAWSNDWGCPLEIERRDERLKPKGCVARDGDSGSNDGSNDGINGGDEDEDGDQHACPRTEKDRVQNELSYERYRRIESFLSQDAAEHRVTPQRSPSMPRVIDQYDLLFVQEITPNMSWDMPRGVPLPASRFIDCGHRTIGTAAPPDGTQFEPSIQRIWSKGAKLHWINSMAFANQDIPGCVASFWVYDSSILIAASIHAKAGSMRDDETRPVVLQNMMREVLAIAQQISPARTGINFLICGDWNVELSVVAAAIQESPHADGYDVTVGLLPQDGAQGDSAFSTNHESGFVAQYDGCILWSKKWLIVDETADQSTSMDGSSGDFGASHGSMDDETSADDGHNAMEDLVTTKRETTGFMPKGVGGKLTGTFQYRYPDPTRMLDEMPRRMEDAIATETPALPPSATPGVYHDGTLIPNSVAEHGMSDHMLITTYISIPTHQGTSPTLAMHQIIVFLAGMFAGIYLLVSILAWQLRLRVRRRRRRRDYHTVDTYNRDHDDYEDDDGTSTPGSEIELS